jgi:hypothetical protein
MQNTGKRCVILLVFIILRWSFNYESNVFRFNKILIDCVFGNSKFIVPSTLTIHLGFASVNSQCLRDNKLAIPSYSVNKYIIFENNHNMSLVYRLIRQKASLLLWLKPQKTCFGNEMYKILFLQTRGKFCGAIFDRK